MIEPIKVIIQDFPLFLSENLYMKLFAINISGKLKERTVLHRSQIKISPMAILSNILKNSIRIFQNTKLYTKVFAIKNNISVKLVQRSELLTKFRVNAYNTPNTAKILQRGTGKVNISNKIYTTINGVSVGMPLTLGYWDKHDNTETELGTMDILTMKNCSLLIVN